MELRKSSRKRAKIRLGLQGPSGSGKTMSALLIAYGLVSDWTKIAVLDTEANSADLYSHLGEFNVINLSQPFTPERYIEAVKLCEDQGMEVIIVDSVSHEWDGAGGILSIHSAMTGNSFTNWSRVSPRHNCFVQAMLQSSAHIIATIRSKQDYVLSQKEGKVVPEKVGLKGVTKEGLDYELTLVFNIDGKNQASATKDRTSLFIGKPEEVLSIETGKKILSWCNEGVNDEEEIKQLIVKIQSVKDIDELLSVYKNHPQYQEKLLPEFSRKRADLEKPILKPIKAQKNGTAK